MSTPYPEPQLDPLSSPDSGTTGLLERERVEQPVEPGDHERFAHYVRKEKVLESALSGEPVVALCGKVWVPGRDPKKFPVCPMCKEIYEGLRPAGDGDQGGSGSGSGNGSGELTGGTESLGRSEPVAVPPGSALEPPYLITTVGLVALATLIAFEALAVSTAMPIVAVHLHAGREYGFAFSLFLTASLLGVVVSGGWCDARGPLGPVRVGLGLFVTGVLLCGLAPTFGLLLAGRAVSGAGAGLLGVAIYVVIADVFPSDLQPRAFSLLSAGWVLPGIVGPVLAGWLAQHVCWRAVFLCVPPLIVPPALALLPRLRARHQTRLMDDDDTRPPTAVRGTRGRILAGAGLAGGVLALQWGLGGLGRFAGAQQALAAVAMVAGVLLIFAGFRPLVPAGTLRLRRGLPTVIVLRCLYAATFFGAESFIPLMLVSQRGLSATEAGLVLTGGTLGWTVGSFVQARPGFRGSEQWLMALGAAVLGSSEWALVLAIRPPVPAWVAMPIWAVTALGMGLVMAGTSVLTLRLSDPGAEGRNSAALQLSDALGGALGIGLTGAAFAARHHPGGSDALLFTGIWLATGTVAVLAAAIAVRVRPAPSEI